MKCEITWCQNERACLYYCHDHHVVVCVEGNSNISAIRPTKRATDSPKAGGKSAKRKVVKAKVIRPAKSG